MDSDLYIDQQVTSGRLKGIIFNILSEEDAGKISTIVVGTVHEVSDPALGVPNRQNKECFTCGSKLAKECEGHFGLINFPFTILNPYFMSEVAQILNKICPGCKYFRHDKVKQKNDFASSHHQSDKCKYCDKRSKGLYPKMVFKVSSKDVFAKSAIIAEVNEKLGNAGSFKGLPSDYWDIIPKDSTQEQFLQPNRRVLSPAQIYSILKDVRPRILESLLKRKNSIFLNFLLVTPNNHRVREFGQHITQDETTVMYRKLIDFRGTPNELSARLRSEKLSTRQQIYADLSSRNDSAADFSGLKHVKELLLGKRTDHSFRLVVVGDPSIKVDEIGLPIQIAENVLIKDHINLRNWEKLEPCCDLRFFQKGELSVIRNNTLKCIRSKDMLQVGDTVSRPLMDGDIILINRPPSIHQHSLIALSVKVLPINSVVSINPLICSPLRGDFDGDCLHGYAPQSVESRVELSELVALNKQLVNGQSGQNLLSLSHDSLSAAYLILEDGVLLSEHEMQQLQMSCTCLPQLPAIVKSSSDASFWTGKQLFSLLLPRDFEFDFPDDGVHIREGELVTSSYGSSWLRDCRENFFQCLLRHCGEKTLDFLGAAQDVLCEWLSTRGLSVSLLDLCLTSDPQSQNNIVDDISSGLQEAEELSYISCLMVDYNQKFLIESSKDSGKISDFQKELMHIVQQKSEALSQASISAFKKVFRDIQNLVYHYVDDDNSLIAMLKAGSKGNLQKLVQHSMCLGLQHSLVPLSFSIPSHLSCTSWNNQKRHADVTELHGAKELSHLYFPFTVVASSFLSGLNPLESFVLSLTTRDSSFGGHADVSGTLTRKLMFFMRDVVAAYDGTVRNCYGNHIVQFSYCTEDVATTHNDVLGSSNIGVGGHPVGSLAACAVSEAAYSALDQPVSALGPSPLLAIKKVFECGVNKSGGDKSASLFLSRRLGKWVNGYEYGALEVKNHLERLFFSDIVSEVRICFSSQTDYSTIASPWEIVEKRRLKLQSVMDALSMQCYAMEAKPKTNLPNLRIVWFPEVKKVDILWKDESNHPKGSSGELFLRVSMSEKCDRTKFWSILTNHSLRIRNIIDWDRSHPDGILDYSDAYGIDIAWQYFVNSLNSAVSDTDKSILPEHLIVTANCLTATGNFLPINAKGLAQQRKEADVYSPFTQAFFSNPSECFIKAAKMGQVDRLQGSVDALSWGQTPSIGTGCQFDIVYNGKGHELSAPADVYCLLKANLESVNQNENIKLPLKQMSEDFDVQRQYFTTKLHKSLSNGKFSTYFSVHEIQKISRSLKRMLHEYAVDCQLSGEDKFTALRALQFHPRWKEKIGTGAMEIKVGRHPKHEESRCFVLVRTDGTVEDFSYHKCVHHALKLIAPQRAKAYVSKWLNGKILLAIAGPMRFSGSRNGKAFKGYPSSGLIDIVYCVLLLMVDLCIC
ncbi:DNA-directed RNA polymerase IV subunit 1-like [Dorcoceras hygrometricum]|uniref:DNA-directed RNA polymerase subunit n=1 Tax=Dorcoceras hygrometricum TaxID=472368 RepID=A0A2Z7CCC8_9LAMI|nr:DNA-directed RNA polymerase IV subunit 1-like [Dorcoceras hygrometricum]